MSHDAIELAVTLGPRKSLVGVVTKARPTEAASASGDRPMMVILNSGIIHRVGANRLSVRLARTLAAAGYDVVRFDLSGIGDSEPRTDALAPLDAALADIQEALDSLEQMRNVRQFVLIGLCSGANHSVIHGGVDSRIVGAVLLEPSIPPPPRHYVHHYGRRVFRLQSWRGALRRDRLLRSLRQPMAWIRAARGKRDEATDDEPGQPKITDPEVKAFLEGAYRKLIDRHLPLLVVLTGESWYYAASFVDAFPNLHFGEEVMVELIKEADHVFTPRLSADRLTRLLLEWTGKRWPTGVSRGA